MQLNNVTVGVISEAIKIAVFGEITEVPFIENLSENFKRAYDDEELIWNLGENDDISTIVSTYISRTFSKYSSYKNYIDKTDGTYDISRNGKIINRSVNSTVNSAVESQPLNSSIDEITSPTAKTRNINNGTDNATENGTEYDIDRLKALHEYGTIYYAMWNDLVKMLDYYCKIY